MAHYFENDNQLKSHEIPRRVVILDQPFTFLTDHGVFSKKGLDFGTRTLLENIDLSKIKGQVLDFGCGYGPIAIFLGKVTEATIDAVDINQRSLHLAKKNAKKNHVDINFFESNLYENVNKKYDVIVSNPPIRAGKKVLYEILMGAKDYLKQKGELWIVVHKDQGAKSVVKDLEKKYSVEVVCKNKGFYIICARND